MNVQHFIKVYKKIIYDNRHHDAIPISDVEVIVDEYYNLDKEDRAFIAGVLLNEFKRLVDDPLTKKQIATLKFINNKELIALKTWISKIAFIGMVIVVGLIVISITLVRLPKVTEDISVLVTDLSVSHTPIGTPLPPKKKIE